MINNDSIVTAYDEHLTLVEWLQKVETALKDASAVSFNVNKRGDATLTFSVVFEDGSEIESNPITLQQGESVHGATIRNGHLILTLTNGDELDAGDLGGVSGFSIDASQHLIVTYQNGSTQDLGAIFTGNVTLTGTLTAQTSIKTPVLTSDADEISAQKPVVEIMQGYSAGVPTYAGFEINKLYAGVVKNGNKITFVACGSIKRLSGTQSVYTPALMNFYIPNDIGNKIFPFKNSLIYGVNTPFYKENDDKISKTQELIWIRQSDRQVQLQIRKDTTELEADTLYYYRSELTILLSDSL